MNYACCCKIHQVLMDSCLAKASPGMWSPLSRLRHAGNWAICLIVGPTRSGKGLLATSQLLSWKHSVIVNDIKGELFTQTAGYRESLGPVFVIDPTGVGHAFDPLLGKNSEDELYSAASHLLFNPREGEGLIFTQRATVMLTQLFLAARMEKQAPLPYVRHIIRLGLAGAAARLNQVDSNSGNPVSGCAFQRSVPERPLFTFQLGNA